LNDPFSQNHVRPRLSADGYKSLTIALLLRQNAARLAEIDEKIQEIEAAIKKIIGRDAELARRFGILLSIPGVSEITAFALLIEMLELGSLEGKQAARLAGLAPVARQSGTWKGHAFVHGGRASLRQALYMPALVAARFNAGFKAAYARLLKAGKPAKVAITAVMRKLLLIATALLRDNRPWSEKTT
jgi:transposase